MGIRLDRFLEYRDGVSIFAVQQQCSRPDTQTLWISFTLEAPGNVRKVRIMLESSSMLLHRRVRESSQPRIRASVTALLEHTDHLSEVVGRDDPLPYDKQHGQHDPEDRGELSYGFSNGRIMPELKQSAYCLKTFRAEREPDDVRTDF